MYSYVKIIKSKLTPPLMIVICISLIVTLFVIQEIRTQYKIGKINKKMAEKQRLALLKYTDHKQYLEQLEKQQINAKKKYIYRKLHELYYNGVPDKYDLKGKKIKGVVPDPTKAINYLILADNFGDQDAALKLAKIHHHGMYKLDPNYQKAKQYYNQAINNAVDRDQRIDAQEALRSLLDYEQKLSTYKWLNIKPPKQKNEHHELIKKQYQPTPPPARTPFTPQPLWGGGGTEIQTATLFRATPNYNQRRYRHPRGVRTERMEDPIAVVVTRDTNPNYNDAHNTHNSQVLSTIKNSLNKLKKSTKMQFSLPDSIRSIRNYIVGRGSSDKQQDALNSLDSIEKSTSPLTFCKMKEVDALNLVWNRIHNDKHSKNRDDLKDTLFNELAEMQEHGKTVCSTGKFTRIVDTLNVVDDEVAIKPTYAINQEMMDKSAKIRNEMLEKFDENEKKKLEMGTSSNQDEFDNKLKTQIKTVLHKDYVESKILTEERFNSELNKWIDHI